uniref:Uncharacterized protein n=1 Tax=Rangifer tarandus platyrhynchus TaxID=3082113 RepID=A0ACB0E9E8_RANTA|nr:unnamed protein product [Rangifer tarandus platyrhynchus]
MATERDVDFYRLRPTPTPGGWRLSMTAAGGGACAAAGPGPRLRRRRRGYLPSVAQLRRPRRDGVAGLSARRRGAGRGEEAETADAT